MVNEIGKRGRQIRGSQLEEELSAALLSWWLECSSAGVEFKYTQAGFARKTGVSRETVRSKQDVLDAVLEGIAVRRRMSSGSEGLAKEREKNARLKAEIVELKEKLEVLRRNHLEIYRKLYRFSFDFSVLIKDNVSQDDMGRSVCRVCSAAFDV